MPGRNAVLDDKEFHMLNRLPFRVRIEQDGPHPRARNRKRGASQAIAAVIGVASLLPIVLVALPADAATSGVNSATLTLTPPAVRSVTVTPATSAFNSCSGGTAPNSSLVFPNGTCTIPGGITVTNGTVAGHIDVTGAAAAPSDAGTGWALVVPGNGASPAVDQYAENLVGVPASNSVKLSTTIQCDTAFSNTCAASANQGINEVPTITGPTTSSDAGPFTITTTWTAVP